MLKRADEGDFPDIIRLCRDNIIGTRILCYILAYGFNRDFLEIWIIRQESTVTGVLVKFYDDITLLSEDGTDTQQLSVFLGMLCFRKLICKAELCRSLDFDDITVKNAYRFNSRTSSFEADMLEEDGYEEAYNLICKEIPDSFSREKEAYLSFLSDFTFRKRRLLARGVCTHSEGVLSSVALTSSETDNAAIISGVACDGRLQKKGLGKKTVHSLINLLEKDNKTVYVIALNKSAEGFYEHIGFIKEEEIGFVERKNNV